MLRSWGKAGRGLDEGSFHPLIFHNLDVAACGRLLLERDRLLCRRLADVSGLPDEALPDWITFLLAIHDTGKYADGFQNLRPALMERLQGRTATVGYPERHDLLGYRLWTELLAVQLRHPAGPIPAEGSWEDWRDLLTPWIAAAMGHHGRPPLMKTPREPLRRQFPADAERDALGWLRFAAAAWLPAGLPFPLEPLEEWDDRFRRASWLFAGLAVAADWIGSNATWFPFRPEALDPAVYWRDVALPQAEQAVAAAGFLPVAPSRTTGLAALWPALSTPTPLQALAETLPLAPGPQLIVIEEVTGGGKTEAALTLAHRLLAAGEATGLYLGLPTMATANAMVQRVAAVSGRLFAAGAEPSLVLAHARRHLFLPLETTATDSPYATDDRTASLHCAAWLADSRKKALLAQLGVGTIDQALLAVLPHRHQSLRLWGLAGKVLIVDEVHACDSYMRGLLCELLRFHAAFGGSALLLSATLPRAQRQELLRAFASGAGLPPPEPASGEYPLLTHLSAAGCAELPVAARSEASRRTAVRPLRSPEEAEAALVQTAEAGGCAAWVRNTVADALAAYLSLTARLGPERVSLFHSRFTAGDRAEIEAAVLRRFGPQSGAAARRGHVLIATQVIEQSLDIDFDVLVSDLAPIDLLIQRAGRLRRHRRTREGDRTEGPDGRGDAVLWVLGPEPGPEAAREWFAAMFPEAAFVYPDHGRLWLSANWLEEHGGFRSPEDARELIEWVYGEESEERIPTGLQGRSERAEGKSRADRGLARHSALKLDQGYVATSLDWPEDVFVPTRLGEASVTVRLVRRVGEQLEPWYPDDLHAWDLSGVPVRRSRVSIEDPAFDPAVLESLRARMRDEGRYAVIVVLEEQEGRWMGGAVDAEGRPVTLAYDPETGLTWGR
ncbi:MAG TPA: CRISPR-associated helicase Cas3' [Thermoanaerobaculia bacterium]|nr:CRISPR-associated helicase Cas3' [Thermoanaerobaculia bacterium]